MYLSPGLAFSCFQLLELVERYPRTFGEYRHSFTRIGVTPTPTVIELVQRLGWAASGDDENAALSPRGVRLMAHQTMALRLRQVILDYVDVVCPPWLQNAAFGRQKVLGYISSDVFQVFLEAGLVAGTSEDVIQFWDSLAARARGQTVDVLLAIGRRGKWLSLLYEQQRTGRTPKWISIDNSEDGYDILSVLSDTCPEPLSIEVKTTTMRNGAIFHLTRNEWERATAAERHLFHLWRIDHQSPSLAIVRTEDLRAHMAEDVGDGIWGVLAVPFDTFADRFSDIRLPATLV